VTVLQVWSPKFKPWEGKKKVLSTEVLKKYLLEARCQWHMPVNPSYLGAESRRILNSRPAQAKLASF
jgi:hypothetical protein